MSSFIEQLTTIPGLVGIGLGLIAFVVVRALLSSSTDSSASPSTPAPTRKTELTTGEKAQAAASVMSAPTANLPPPKEDPISVAELAKYDGSDASKPIYVAIKGRIYDVSTKREMYGQGAGYNVFAGKDASRGLGMSSLEAKDAVADYSTLTEAQLKTLNQWDSFFEKRYPIIGKVVP